MALFKDKYIISNLLFRAYFMAFTLTKEYQSLYGGVMSTSRIFVEDKYYDDKMHYYICDDDYNMYAQPIWNHNDKILLQHVEFMLN